jgi:mannose-6-phosphate isomerase-like protein (cupin superfamily)
MATYGKKNIADLTNAAEQFGLAPDLEARFGRKAFGMSRGGFSYQRMAPGFRSAFGHRHSDQEEIYVVLSGNGRARLDDEEVSLETRDVLLVGPETWRAFEAGDEGLELLVCGFGEGGDSETDQGFWPKA